MLWGIGKTGEGDVHHLFYDNGILILFLYLSIMKLSANRKLFLGFSLAIIIAIFIGVANYLTFRQQAVESDWVAHSYRVMNKINEVQNNATEMQTRRRGYRATGDRSFLDAYYANHQALLPAMEQLRLLVSDNPVQSKNAEQVITSVNAIIRFWDGLPTDVSHYTHEDIVRITKEERQYMDKVRAAVGIMLDVERKLLDERQASNKAALARASAISIIGTILVQIIILLLIYFIIKEFRSRQRAEEKVRENLHEVHQLNEAANEKNWLLSGVSAVNDNLQGAGDMETLSRNVVQALVRYIDAPAAALYVYDDERQELVMRAAASLPGDALRRYKIGEGLVGHAATVREMLITKNVPGSYWKLQSAAGGLQPGEILCLPLVTNSELKGVLEIANFQSFTPSQIQLVDSVSDNIAIAINAADARDKVMVLLAQVQEQKVHLQNQQEELRQTNEELTRQAEVLQASEEELRVQEEELRQINAELEEKNEAVEVSRRALANKARELEITSKYKSEFLANMSHELRTPLNSVLILAKLLSENKSANLTDKQVEYSRIIHKSGTDLLNLINDILDLSKIEAGKIDFHFEDVNVKGIMEDIRQTFTVLAEQKGINYVVEKSSRTPEHIVTDKQRLEQVIKNLLSNAFKFTPKDGAVTLSFNVVNGAGNFVSDRLLNSNRALEISVADTGIGISPDKQQLIFEAFQQADGSTSRKYGGTGLGLSISKELVKRLGGELKVVSEEGKGSTFYIYLPLEKTDLQTTPASDDLHAAEERQVPIEELTNNVITQHDVADDREQIGKGDKVMLIIEDDPQFAKLVQDFAREKKFKTIVALKGDEGLYYANKYKPSAIILDMQLPVLDGWSLLKIFKSDEKLRRIPVHVMSAMDNLDRLKDSAIAYLKKPIDKDVLEEAFLSISKHISAEVKKILIVAGEYIKDDTISNVLSERYPDADVVYALSEPDAAQQIETASYDCVVVDIGKDLANGTAEAKRLHTMAKAKNIPVILYIDKELSSSDELQLKKISDVVIQNSDSSKNRLLDELELFLYAVDEHKTVPQAKGPDRMMEKSLKGRKVLLADDDMRNVFALSTLLEEQEMVVVAAENGKDAISQLNEHPDTDIVLMDVMMPEMDGYEATRLIRSDVRFKGLPIIALTAKAMHGDREKSIQAGASDYITKPVDSSKLFSLMRVWLSA
ncbi:response regulator [Polluticoccus soli]|uniref:response regulator n=1 Tax=Polluticoccus soli TaxID=3034150 RepID=UPI0023E341CD|nr:response regulator [Flavipsychrobacter sp. JY13-12]